jgi:hypothetical protein
MTNDERDSMPTAFSSHTTSPSHDIPVKPGLEQSKNQMKLDFSSWYDQYETDKPATNIAD